MQFLTSLFGGSENTVLTAALALGVVLVLIVFSVWVLKFFFRASTNLARGSNKRLNVMETVAVDQRRTLLLVRRDNVEHLIMTGGPQDLLVESGIPVEKPASIAARRRAANEPGPTERPAPSQPVTDALAVANTLHAAPLAPAAPPAAVGPRPMERLRELARPMAAAARKSGSIRHTGLMRPVSQGEPAAVIPINPDNSDHRRIDSAKAAPANDTNGQSRVGGGSYLGDGFKAEQI